MTTAYWCVLAAGLMPYLFTGLAKASGGRYNNAAPREFLAGLRGWGQRANWAQMNSFEAFPLFAAAVVIAQARGLEQGLIDNIALGFIVARLFYGAFYILDKATLRSLAWMGGMACCVALFVMN